MTINIIGSHNRVFIEAVKKYAAYCQADEIIVHKDGFLSMYQNNTGGVDCICYKTDCRAGIKKYM